MLESQAREENTSRSQRAGIVAKRSKAVLSKRQLKQNRRTNQEKTGL
jgi:hypothetical protein